MALSYRQVSDLYGAAPRQQNFQDWAASMDQLVGDSQYSEAAHDPYKVKAVSTGIDKLLEATGVPWATEKLGGAVGSLVGNEEAGARIGHGLPRATLNFAPLLALSAVQPEVGLPLTAAALGASAGLTGAETYTETGSPTAGVVSGATAAIMPGVTGAVERKVGQYALEKLGGRLVAGDTIDEAGRIAAQRQFFPTTTAQKVIAGGAAYGAGQVAAAGVGEAGMVAQEKLTGQPLSNPLSTDNLLNLTLGQAPFALIHATRSVMGRSGKTPMQQADLLQLAIDKSEPAILAHQAEQERRNRPDVAGIPAVEQKETTPEIQAQIESALARVRGKQLDIRNDPNLSEPERVKLLNDESEREYQLLQKKAPTPQAVFGNTIVPGATQRQELVGRQVWVNALGTARRILVAEDPQNPPELWNHVIGYSTKDEPAPKFGLMTLETQVGGGPNTGLGTFSLPVGWQSTPKPAYEYFANQKSPETRRTAEQVKMEGSTIDPVVEPLVKALNGKNVITTGSDERSVKVENAHVDESKLPPNWRYDPDTGNISKVATVTDQGPLKQEEIQPIVNAVTPFPRQKITVGGAEGQTDLPVAEDPMTPAELQAHLHEIDRVIVRATAADTPLEGQMTVVDLQDIQNGHELPVTDDTTLKPIMESIADKDVIDPNRIPQAAIVVAANLTKEQLKAKQKALTPEQKAKRKALNDLLSSQARGEEEPVTFASLGSAEQRTEIAKVAEMMGGAGEGDDLGFSVRKMGNMKKLFESDTPIMTDELAKIALEEVSKGTDALAVFKKWNIDEDGEEKSTFKKDAKDFFDIVNNFKDLAHLPYEKVAEFLNARNLSTKWNEYEVASFMIRPHVSMWLKAMDDNVGRKFEANAARIAAHTLGLQTNMAEAIATGRVTLGGGDLEHAELRDRLEQVRNDYSKYGQNFLDSAKLQLALRQGTQLTEEQLAQAQQHANKPFATSAGYLADILQGKLSKTLPWVRSPTALPDVSRAQGIPAGGGFIFGLKPTEQIQGMPKSGVMPESKFTSVGSDSGAFSKEELQLMKQLVPHTFYDGKVDVYALQGGLKERGPIVDVNQVKPQKGYTGHLEAAALQHDLETRGYDVGIEYDEAIARDPNGKEIVGDWVSDADLDPEHQVRLDSLPVTDRSLISQWFEHAQAMIGDEPTQETFAFVAPKKTGDMSNYRVLSLKERAPTQLEAIREAKAKGLTDQNEIEKYVQAHMREPSLRPDPHFGKGVFAFARMYDEIGMLNRKTGQLIFDSQRAQLSPELRAEMDNPKGDWIPNGEKATHVIEVQGHPEFQMTDEARAERASDAKRQYDLEIEFLVDAERFMKEHGGAEKVDLPTGPEWAASTGASYDTEELAIRATQHHLGLLEDTLAKSQTRLEKYSQPPHPFAKNYEQMALKAAIQHAKASGATKIILSDGKTLAMTEGHDKVVAKAIELQNEPQYNKDLAANKASSLLVGGAKYHIEDVKPPSGEVREWKVVFDKLPFIAGDEFHYDKSMPATLERLTKSKPEMVDLGEHKNALSGGTQEGFIDEADARARADELRQQMPTRPVNVLRNEAGRWVVTQYERSGSPVLKDAEGNAKTNITGRMYDLAQVPNEFTLMGKSRTQDVAGGPKWLTEPNYAPTTPSEIHYATQFGLDENGRGNGHGIINYLKNHDNPFYRALALDLQKLGPDSLSRVLVQLKQAEGSYLRQNENGTSEITLAANVLNGSSDFHANVLAHELIHGLTANEMDNPLKKHIVQELDRLRERLINNLSPELRAAHSQLMEQDWYARYGRNEVGPDMNEAVDIKGKLTEQEQGVLYGLMTTKEMVAQGISNKPFREHMQSVPMTGKNVFSRMVNSIRALLGIGEKISGTEFELFLARTDQLIEAGNYVSSFKNFTDRYFERLGQTGEMVDTNTKRAMSLINDSVFGTSPADLLFQVRMGAMVSSPEAAQAYKALHQMIQLKGDDYNGMMSILAEQGYPDQLNSMLDSMLLGEVPNHGDVLDTLPPEAANYIFAYARDAKMILGSIQEATREANAGLLNIADPKLISGPVAESLKLVDSVLKYEKEQQIHQQNIDSLEGIPPSGFVTNVVQNPEILPAWAMGVDKTKLKESHWYDLEPIAQWARRVPEIAEIVSKGWQLAANARKMSTEALKAFGTDLQTMSMSKASVKLMEKMLGNSKLTRAVDQWIYTNQKVGQEKESVQMLDANHPDIEKILLPLSPTERDQAEELVQKHQISQQQMQAQILEKQLQIASTRGAELTGLPLKQGVRLSSTLIEALRADRNNPVAAASADAQIQSVQMGMQPEQFLTLLKYSEAAVNEWKAVKDFYQANPAWSSGQRYGKFLVSYRRGKKSYLAGVDSKKEAEKLTQGASNIEFKKNQKSEADAPPNLGPDAPAMVQKLRDYQQTQYDMMLNSGRFNQDDIAFMRQTSPAEQLITEEAYRGGVPGLRPEARGLTRGAEELPWLRNHFSWVKKTSTYWSRQLFRAETHANLLDPEITANPELQKKLQTHFDNMLKPDTQIGHFFQRAAMNWFMGFNPASAMVNATQPFLTHTAEFTAMTGKPVDSYRRTIGALKEVAKYYTTGKKSWGDPDLDWFMHKAAQDGERDLHMFDDDPATQETIHTNFKQIMDGNKPQTLGQRLGTMSGSWSTAGMWMFRGVERFNSDAALLSSFKYYKEQGLSREQAQEKAYEFNHTVNYGGGTAGRPAAFFGAVPRTAAMLSTSMQSYVLGTTYQLARYIQKGYFRPAGISPGEVYAARKAAVQMLGVQLASAGVLGMPFVSGAIAVLNQLFPDLEVRKHLQEWMNDLLGSDKENGSILSDAAMMGVPSMFGWDLQSRLSMGNTLPGVSEINGFDPSTLLGAPVNMVSTFVKGGKQLAQGDVTGIDQFVPPALKKIEQYARQGGIATDYRDRPVFTPTKGEVAGMALGFQPRRTTDFNTASRIAKQAQDNITRRSGEFHQQMGEQVLKGNFGNVRGELQKRMREDKKFDVASAVRSIAQTAEDLTFPRDLRREGSVPASDVRARLLRTFNIPPSQADESTRLQFRQGVERRLGLQVSTGSDLRLAQVMDQLRQQSPEATRSDLRRQAERLLRSPRQQTFASPQE